MFRSEIQESLFKIIFPVATILVGAGLDGWTGALASAGGIFVVYAVWAAISKKRSATQVLYIRQTQRRIFTVRKRDR